jgi:GTP-binding protein
MKSDYITSAATPKDLPACRLKEFAFIGRSNVGKSSLINALLMRTGLARTSREPGRTRMANFFSVGDDALVVDLPGYGFAKVDANERKKWEGLMDAYICRPSIAKFLVLVDIRRELEDLDIAVLRMLDGRSAMTLVLTKVDKVSRSEMQSRTKKIKETVEKYQINVDDVVVASSLKKTGIEALRKSLFGVKV